MFVHPKNQHFFFGLCQTLQDDGQMQRVQIFQALPVLLLVLLTLASNFAKDGAIGRGNRRWVVVGSTGCFVENVLRVREGNIQEFVWYIYILYVIIIYTHVQTWYFDILYVTLVTLAYTGFWHPTSCWMVAWAINPLDKSFSINCGYSQDLQKSWETVGWDDMTWQFLHDAGLPLGANPSWWKHWVAQIQWSKALPRSSHYRSISEDQIEVTKKVGTHCWTKCISAVTKSIN